jgi:amino acid transporter
MTATPPWSAGPGPVPAGHGTSGPARRSRRSVVLGVLYVVLIPPTAVAAIGALTATVMGVAASGGDLGLEGAALTLTGFVVMATPLVLLVAAILLLAGRPDARPGARRWGTWVPLPFLAVTAVVLVLVVSS